MAVLKISHDPPDETGVRSLYARQEHSRFETSQGEVRFSLQISQLQMQGIRTEKEGVMDDTSLKELLNDLRHMDEPELLAFGRKRRPYTTS
jgi:hypothetical protein